MQSNEINLVMSRYSSPSNFVEYRKCKNQELCVHNNLC